MPSDLFSDGVEPGLDDVIIALMGMTGAGKSSLISLCSEKKPVIGHDLNSCTQSVDTYPFTYDGPPQKRVFLVDTPGFDDSTRSDAEVLRELAAWLTATYARKIRLSGIVYLHRINQPRMQGSARKNIMMFKKLCGDDALKNVILATTTWDLVDEDLGAAREKQLIDTKEFWGYMASKGSKTYRHDNTHQSAMKLVGHFIDAGSKMTLDIQEEMVDQHKSLDGTGVATIMEARFDQERTRFTAELRNLETDLREALRQKDNDTMEVLREERAKYTADLEQIKAAQESLRITMEKLHQERYAQLEKAMKKQQEAHQAELAAMSISQPSRKSIIKIAASGSTDKLASVDRSDAFSGASNMKIWDPATGQCLSTMTEIQGVNICTIAWSYDKTRLATGTWNQTVQIWDVATSRCVSTLYGHSATVVSVAWSPDGMRLASGSYDNTVKTWDLATGECVSTLDLGDKVKKRSYLTEAVAWSPDGTRLASRFYNGIVDNLSKTLNGQIKPVGKVVWLQDDTRLALINKNNTKVEIWDPAMRRRVSTLKMRDGGLSSMIWSPSGTKFARGYLEEGVHIFDVATGRCDFKLETSRCTSMAWSQDETQFASGSEDCAIKIWNIATGQCTSILTDHDKIVTVLAWSCGLSRLNS